MDIRNKLESAFTQACAARSVPPVPLTDDTVLLETGLDSLGFAVFVTNLEMELGYDPFTLMDQPVYPRTFGEFVAVYERFKEHAAS